MFNDFDRKCFVWKIMAFWSGACKQNPITFVINLKIYQIVSQHLYFPYRNIYTNYQGANILFDEVIQLKMEILYFSFFGKYNLLQF